MTRSRIFFKATVAGATRVCPSRAQNTIEALETGGLRVRIGKQEQVGRAGPVPAYHSNCASIEGNCFSILWSGSLGVPSSLKRSAFIAQVPRAGQGGRGIGGWE